MNIFEEKFWERVDKSGECWLWKRGLSPNGYGRVDLKRPDGFSQYAHRVAYQLTFGSIFPGLCVCHICDNKPCVRPSHLFVGTIADNNHDMKRKGRYRPFRKLTQLDVDLIRAIHAQGGTTQQALSEEFNVCHQHIHDILVHRRRP